MRDAVIRARLAGASVLVAFSVVGCGSAPVSPAAEAPKVRIRLATGPTGGGFMPLGDQLASVLGQRMPQVEIISIASAGAVANINAIQHGSAELAFTFADVAYLAFSGKLDDHTRYDQLRGIAVLQVTPIALVSRPGLTIRSPADLRGRRVGVGPEGSGTAVTAGLLLRAFGLSERDVQVDRSEFREAATRLLTGRLDAMFDNAINPSESLQRVTHSGAHLVPIEGRAASEIRRDYPFLTATVIPGELYGTSVHTIGVDGLLICRRDLDEALVHELTKQLLSSLTRLGRGALRLLDVDQAPATPIPLHQGAARYYRERELSR